MPIVLQGQYFLLSPLAIITSSPLPDALQGSPYDVPIIATGGVPPYIFTFVSGTLAAGLSLLPNGHVSGTTASVETDVFTVRATDFVGSTITKQFQLTIDRAVIVNSSLPDAVQGIAYSQSISVSGGVGPYTVVLNSYSGTNSYSFSNGLVSGTPAVPETDVFTVTATDSNGLQSLSTPVSLLVNSSLVFIGIALPTAFMGQPYSQSVAGQASGGAPPYTFTQISDTGPGVFTTSSGGLVTGTPDVSSVRIADDGSYRITNTGDVRITT